MKRKHKVTFTSRANNDVLIAFEYYESSQKDLGNYFLDSLENSIISIDNNTEIYKFIHKSFQQAKVKRFPYVIIFECKDKEIIILSVFNTYQNPIKKIK
ncbi:hypothetical protein GCM10007424_12830 [Flavobacterium suaedae]|uniref:Type II toxin-antitoxin system RelE/ParE family toxin n=1 Tax=Flavobacterium suaedae TaxID=1767027 RepID=A0ABQ1JPM7_9FLAO|nr:type II toxin-antitoxin system RelE/ParE family toxin [Flavobacterium suaedae]GGB74354.1 hypothetical protein GCM10007424_12830 [Flavobacterium suaedae]